MLFVSQQIKMKIWKQMIDESMDSEPLAWADTEKEAIDNDWMRLTEKGWWYECKGKAGVMEDKVCVAEGSW